MKKTIITILCASSFFAMTVQAFATDSAQTTPGDDVTIAVTNVPSATNSFTFTPSPNVGINIVTSDTAYSIMAANSLTNTTTGLEYGTLSTSSGYAQGTKTTAAGTGPSTTGQDETTLSTDVTWGWIGGS